MPDLFLVTGATGLLGNEIVRQLLQAGHHVRIYRRATSSTLPLKDLDVEEFVGELDDVQSLERAAQGTRAVIHSAALVTIGWTRAAEAQRVNVEGSFNVAQAAAKAGSRFIFVSTVNALAIGAEHHPANESTAWRGTEILCDYVVSKRQAEQRIQSLPNLDWVIVHPGFMLGPRDWKPSSGRMLVTVAKNWIPLAPAGGCSVCDSRDVAQGIVAAIDKSPSHGRYILAGDNVRYATMFEQMATIAGRKPPAMILKSVGRTVVGGIGDLAAKLTGYESDINSAVIGMSAQFHYYDSQLAAKDLGYQSRPWQQSLEDAWHWFLENGYVKR